jgi:hypothetical protein
MKSGGKEIRAAKFSLVFSDSLLDRSILDDYLDGDPAANETFDR